MTSPLPTREEEIDLHRRLLAGDETAVSDLAVRYYEPLLAYLRAKSSRKLPDDVFADAATQAWMSLAKNPGSCEHSLWGLLTYIAWLDLKNVLAKRDRRRKRENPTEHVELFPERGIDPKEAERQADVALRVARIRSDLLPDIEAGLTDGERQCLELLLGGERKTGPYADALGLARRPAAERKAAAKRIKDKLKSRIQRARRNHDDATPRSWERPAAANRTRSPGSCNRRRRRAWP
jgi:hypothetical protein